MLNPGIKFMQGSQALAEAAITAGLRFFAGYPITPASEIAEHLAKELPKVGGIAIQMEDEIASIATIIGASWTGAKVMTATSGPGFSLMQENIGLAFMTETPLVIADMQRAGPSTGQATKCGQGDVMQARWGTHGDYASITLSPNSVQEMFDLTIRAFNLAEKYRTPVILLGDEIIAHMRESIIIPPKNSIEIVNRKKPRPGETMFFGGEEIPPMPSIGEGFNVTVTGSTHDEYGIRITADPVGHRKLVKRLVGKILNNADEIVEVEAYNTENCKIGVVSFGCTSRAVYEAVERANEKGVKTGFIRLKTLWPFPEKQVKVLAQTAKTILVPEMNLRQIFFEVTRVAEGAAKVVPLNKIGGGEMITPEEILAVLLKEGA
ncbi:MAG: 2-oxoacid:acceptor oxidoreductase subunit alpha [Candidatus Bathyarchaeia archaeon]|jgi:2-oxoglutarate ferredoxin oxidoreductase subunit alpha|nr:2-oxoacid:acceptor oxidoreductase subunit alpha [Candidatus Bathyarchaeota archaeon A05DMB-4]MDH7595199.1 2-oxoacid:acceptor oxidoreductase subunit alpha [Candidatus Bathyarchaeota archaeon]